MKLKTLIQKAERSLLTGQPGLATTYMTAALAKLDAKTLGVWVTR